MLLLCFGPVLVRPPTSGWLKKFRALEEDIKNGSIEAKDGEQKDVSWRVCGSDFAWDQSWVDLLEGDVGLG